MAVGFVEDVKARTLTSASGTQNIDFRFHWRMKVKSSFLNHNKDRAPNPHKLPIRI